jgi:hypothetical protein
MCGPERYSFESRYGLQYTYWIGAFVHLSNRRTTKHHTSQSIRVDTISQFKATPQPSHPRRYEFRTHRLQQFENHIAIHLVSTSPLITEQACAPAPTSRHSGPTRQQERGGQECYIHRRQQNPAPTTTTSTASRHIQRYILFFLLSTNNISRRL